MKHGTILVFKHTFGQLVEDNVEAEESGFEYRIGCHVKIRREFYGEKKPPVIDPAVAQWRLRSLRGIKGEMCPTKKIVPGNVSDEELAREAHYRERAARVRFATPEEMRCPAPPLITSEFQEAIRAQMEARNEYVRRAMFRFLVGHALDPMNTSGNHRLHLNRRLQCSADTGPTGMDPG